MNFPTWQELQRQQDEDRATDEALWEYTLEQIDDLFAYHERESARLLVWIDNICADCGRQKAKDETPCEVLCRRCYEECLR